MLIFQIKRIISSEKWFNYVATFFFKMPKIWVGRTTLNREKFEELVSKTLLRSKLSESSLLKNESGSCFERNAFCQKETASHTRKRYSRPKVLVKYT